MRRTKLLTAVLLWGLLGPCQPTFAQAPEAPVLPGAPALPKPFSQPGTDSNWSPATGGGPAKPVATTPAKPEKKTPAADAAPEAPPPAASQGASPPSLPTLPPALPAVPITQAEDPKVPPPEPKPDAAKPTAPAPDAKAPLPPAAAPPELTSAPAPGQLPFREPTQPGAPTVDVMKTATPPTSSTRPASVPPGMASGVKDRVPPPAVSYGSLGMKMTPPAPPGPQTPAVYLEKVGPPTVAAGRPLLYEIVTRNTGSVPVFNVRVEDELPAGARLIGADPRPEVRGDRLAWTLGNLEVGAEKRLRVEIQPAGEGEVAAGATVTFSASSSLRTQIIRPKLALTVTGPEGVQVGDPAEFQVRIANVGSGPAGHVTLHDNLPPGLWHSQGSHIDAEIGTLAPGETRIVPLQLTAVKAGPQVNAVVATADDGLKATAKAQVVITESVLSLKTIAPKRRYLNREALLILEVANNGNAPAADVRVADHLPDGLEFVSASDGGVHDPATRTVSWKVDSVGPAQKKTLSLKVLARAPGDLVNRATAKGTRGREMTAEASVRVEGLAALLCEVASLENPIEVGAETTYEVRVVNQGTAASTGVQVMASVPPGMVPKSATGPVSYRIEGQRVIFEPLAKLAPRADTVFRVRVQGVQPGDMRVKVQLTSDQVRLPVFQEEVTHVYNDRDDATPEPRIEEPKPSPIRRVGNTAGGNR